MIGVLGCSGIRWTIRKQCAPRVPASAGVKAGMSPLPGSR